ncbi:hypothetical protein [Leifsonia sp. Le1]|uniref:hypothetical protein n=1 Tax=Leifsonia sp. Le1 TaxID=3404918 RepID=UPI003EB9CA9A
MVRLPANRARSRPRTSGSACVTRSATSEMPSGSSPLDARLFGLRYFPEASITARAGTSSTASDASVTRSRNGVSALPALRVRSMPSRLTAVTVTPVRSRDAMAGSSESGSR